MKVKNLFPGFFGLLLLICALLSLSSARAYVDLYVGYNSSGQITNFTSGTNAYAQTYVGFYAADSNNLLTVVGSNTLLTAITLQVGESGSGNSLVISNGGTVSNGGGSIAYAASSSNNSVTVSDGLWSNRNILFVGQNGAGSLTISGKGIVSDGIGYLGYGSNSTGSALVNGGIWSNSGSLDVGFFGSGTFTVAGGGSVVAASGITIASYSGSTGTVNIGTYGSNDTAGTIISPSITFGSGSGTLNFNQSDTGTLTSSISGAGIVQQLGQGTTIFSGSNSYTGTTLITNGALATASTNALGGSAVTLTGTATLSLSTNLTISSLIWNSSATVSLSNLAASSYLTVSGALSLTGSGTNIFNLTGDTLSTNSTELLSWGSTTNTLTASSFSILGLSNYTLSISNNALWITGFNPDLYVGSNSTSQTTNFTSGTNNYSNAFIGYSDPGNTNMVVNNTLVVSGTNTLLTLTGTNFVGYNGYNGSSNGMVVSNGGVVTDSNARIGYSNNATNNFAIVTGTGSTWSNSGDLSVGEDGSGNSVVVSNGGTVADVVARIGYNSDSSNNSVLVTGSGSLWSNSAQFGVGFHGSGNSLFISGGGALLNTYAYIGYDSNSTGNSATVTGSGSTWSNNGDLYVGVDGSGNSLVVNSGGKVVNNTGWIGDYGASSNNSVLVTGAGSLWTNSGDLNVGNSGSSNSLVISNGGMVVNNGGWIGYSSTASNNSVLVTGSGSLWSNNGDLVLGHDGSSNSLVISNGAAVANYTAWIGDNSDSSNNTVLVTGSGSLWNNNGDLVFGHDGSSNSLVISNGGTVANDTGWFGNNSDSSNNSVLVTGSGSLWSNRANLYLADSGSGTLTVAAGGSVVAASGITIANQTGSTGTMNIGSLGGSDTAGTLVTPTISFGVGSGTLNFNQSDTATLTSSISGAGTVQQLGAGTTILTDSNSYTGNTYLDAGTLALGNNTALGSSTVSFVSNSTVAAVADITVGNSVIISSNTVGTFNSGTASWTNAGLISGAGTLAASGNGTTTLLGSLLYTGGTVVSGGELLLGSFGSGNANVGNGPQGNGNLTVNGGILRNANGFIGLTAGSTGIVTISGSGSLWSNSGVLTVGNLGSGTLTVANGGTVASSGIVIAASNNSTGTLNIGSLGGSDSAGSITAPTIAFGSGSGTLNFNQINSTAIPSVISGNGTVQQLGSGTTILSGNNSYTGATTISKGTLATANSTALGGSTVNLLGGRLSIQSASPLAISSLNWNSAGVISLPGVAGANGGSYLAVSNAVTLTGSATNSFDLTGDILGNTPQELLSWGSLAGNYTTSNFGILGLSGNYSLLISNNALWIEQSVSSGLIAYTTNTVVTGTSTYPTVSFQTNGILTITPGANLSITSGVTTTNNGTVVLNGILNTPFLNVVTGGKLIGNGTLNGGLTNSGTFLPGTGSTGTLTVNGNFTQTAGGAFILQASSGSQYNHLQVGGTTTLGGTLVVTGVGGYGLNFGDKYTFLNSSGSISGSFSAIDIPAPYRARVVIAGDPTATVIIAPQSYAYFAQNQNQLHVATALNSFTTAVSGDQLVVSTALDSLTASQYNAAFNAIMPSLYQSMSTVAFNLANAQNSELVQRLWSLRVAGTGFSMTGFAENTFVPQGQDKGVLDAKKDILRPGADSHWGMFVDGNGIFAVANSANMLPNYNAQSGGVTTGLTYKWNEAFGTGIYAGYEGSYVKYPGVSQGSTSALIDNSVRFGLFGTYGQPNGKGFYADALAGGGYNNYQVSRNISFTGINRTANSTPGAGELDSMLAGGYDVKKGNWTFGPTTSLQYTYFGANAVNETGAQSLDFNSGGWNTSSLLYSLGAHAAYTWQANRDIVVVPQLSFSWQHEFMQNPYAISGSIGGSPAFANTSSAPLRDTLYTGVGFTVEFYKKWNTSLFYNASAGNQNLASENIFWSAGVKF